MCSGVMCQSVVILSVSVLDLFKVRTNARENTITSILVYEFASFTLVAVWLF